MLFSSFRKGGARRSEAETGGGFKETGDVCHINIKSLGPAGQLSLRATPFTKGRKLHIASLLWLLAVTAG
jgi:hypothetical protein